MRWGRVVADGLRERFHFVAFLFWLFVLLCNHFRTSNLLMGLLRFIPFLTINLRYGRFFQ